MRPGRKVWLTLVWLVGCAAEDPAQEGASPAGPVVVPDKLDQVQVAPGFQFNTTRSVSLRLSVPAGETVRGLELRRESGVLVYSGGIPAGSGVLKLSLPLGEHQLRARWRVSCGEQKETVVELKDGQEMEVSP